MGTGDIASTHTRYTHRRPTWTVSYHDDQTLIKDAWCPGTRLDPRLGNLCGGLFFLVPTPLDDTPCSRIASPHQLLDDERGLALGTGFR